jgi:hypothetical protein
MPTRQHSETAEFGVQSPPETDTSAYQESPLLESDRDESDSFESDLGALDILRRISAMNPQLRDAAAAIPPSQFESVTEQFIAAASRIVNSARGAAEHSAALEQLKTSVTPETARGLQATENAYRRIGEEFGYLTSTAVSQLVGSKTANRELAVRLRREGKVLGIRRLNKFLFPRFQFTARGQVHPNIPPMIKMAKDAGWDSDALLLWLNNPTSRFDDDRRPIDHLDDTDLLLDALEQAANDKW